jgi:hypothetical protein
MPYVAHYVSNASMAGSAVPAGWVIAVPTLIFLFLFIRKIIMDKQKRNQPQQ